MTIDQTQLDQPLAESRLAVMPTSAEAADQSISEIFAAIRAMAKSNLGLLEQKMEVNPDGRTLHSPEIGAFLRVISLDIDDLEKIVKDELKSISDSKESLDKLKDNAISLLNAVGAVQNPPSNFDYIKAIEDCAAQNSGFASKVSFKAGSYRKIRAMAAQIDAAKKSDTSSRTAIRRKMEGQKQFTDTISAALRLIELSLDTDEVKKDISFHTTHAANTAKLQTRLENLLK